MTRAREIKVRKFTRGLAIGTLIISVFGVWICALVLPVRYWPIGFLSAVTAVFAAATGRHQTRPVRELPDTRRITPVWTPARRGNLAQCSAKGCCRNSMVDGGLCARHYRQRPGVANPKIDRPLADFYRDQAAQRSSAHERVGLNMASGMTYGISMTEFGAGITRLAQGFGRCAHPGAVPVNSLVTGEQVAWLCVIPECDAQLPVEWPGPQPRPFS